MRYLGIARKEKDQVLMPDTFQEMEEGRVFEVIEIGGDILLLSNPWEKDHLTRVEQLAKESITQHRQTLKDLAR